MKNLTFNIAASRFRCFTAAQEIKVKEGIAIFQEVLGNSRFKEKVCDFVWSAESGNAFNRFLMSKGMSNTQVCEIICNTSNKMVVNNTILTGKGPVCNIVPCCNSNEYVYCCNNAPLTNICINTTKLNQDWYTPVHVAAAIMHEWCISRGFCCTTNGTLVANYASTVPYACGKITMEVAKEICSSDPAYSKYFDQITLTSFDYCPCSTAWATETTLTEVVNVCDQIDQVVTACATELDWLSCIKDKTQDEVNRTTVLTNCIANILEIKTRLVNTTLDGSETVLTPQTEQQRVTVGL